jgi:hypothetical protein
MFICNSLFVIVRIKSDRQCHINQNSDNDFFNRTARVGYIEKAIDIYSRRGAENAKED